MSYDLRIGVKVEGADIIAVIAEPAHAHPTYNLREMFQACTEWEYTQGEWYAVSEVYPLIQHGLAELIAYPERYRKYEPENKWGTVESAITALQSLKERIDEIADEHSEFGWNVIPKEHLWVAW